MKWSYRVRFKYYDGYHKNIRTIETPSNICLEQIKEGFWVNEDWNFVNVCEPKYFVMPHHIIYIERIQNKC